MIDVDVEIESKLMEMEELARKRVVKPCAGYARIGAYYGALIVRAWKDSAGGENMDYWIETQCIDRATARYHLSIPVFGEIE